MKKLYLMARAHMDPIWLRCFEDHDTLDAQGGVVRPYADVEELQLLEYMDFAEKYGVKYHIEQSVVIKKFLERNPDQAERFRSLVQRGLLEPAGGGEAVIDCNLTQGESWARNHLYSRMYYRRAFGHSPRYAITPDIFGLPAQLPQFFRSLGYDALIVFDRVLKNNKPFWRGLDGSLIVLDSRFLQPPEPNLRTADCFKLPACPACGGEGCDLCEGTGIDVSHDMTRPDKPEHPQSFYGNRSAGALLDELLETPRDEYFMMVTTEEPRIGDFLYGPLAEEARQRGIEVRYVGFEENHELWCPGQVAALRRGDVPEDQIETRPEGNPAAAGCYSSRIEIKKENRALEDLLLEAETLAVLARLNGALPPGGYPAKKIEALWNKMALIQFHDSVTGSHCDAAYTELRRMIREVRRGAWQIFDDAAAALCEPQDRALPERRYAAVWFNPTARPAAAARLHLHAPAGTAYAAVYDAEGQPAQVLSCTATPMAAGVGLDLLVSADTPAFGQRLFFWEPAPAPQTETARGGVIENECCRITADRRGITEIFDKQLGRAVWREAGLAIGTDIGSPWGRSEPERCHRRLPADEVVREQTGACSRLILSGTLHEPQNGINKLAWQTTVTLFPGEKPARFETTLDWDGTNTRVFASFVPAFACGEDLFCEVPFGMMRRPQPPEDNCLGLTDEWPTLGYAGVSDGKTSAAVLKGGLPATRLHDGALEISLLRAFSCGDPKYSGTNDPGRHTARYALTSWAGGFADGNAPAASVDFHRIGHTFELTAVGKRRAFTPGRSLPAAGTLCAALAALPATLRVSALKWAEDGSGAVLRLFEAVGKPTVLTLPENVSLLRCDTLERPTGEPAGHSYTFRPFEIATFRIRFGDKTDRLGENEK